MFHNSLVEFLRYSCLCEIRKKSLFLRTCKKNKVFSIKFPTSPLLCRNDPIFLCLIFPTSLVNTEISCQLLAKYCWLSSNHSNNGVQENLNSCFISITLIRYLVPEKQILDILCYLKLLLLCSLCMVVTVCDGGGVFSIILFLAVRGWVTLSHHAFFLTPYREGFPIFVLQGKWLDKDFVCFL